jgi:hypothetical protein
MNELIRNGVAVAPNGAGRVTHWQAIAHGLLEVRSIRRFGFSKEGMRGAR